MTFLQYLKHVRELDIQSDGKLRVGQLYWNALPDELTKKVPESLDPYYDDTVLPAFLQFIPSLFELEG